jgi:hypothetical protein
MNEPEKQLQLLQERIDAARGYARQLILNGSREELETFGFSPRVVDAILMMQVMNRAR